MYAMSKKENLLILLKLVLIKEHKMLANGDPLKLNTYITLMSLTVLLIYNTIYNY